MSMLEVAGDALATCRRHPKAEGLALSFKTPDEWLTSHAIRRQYDNLSFDRNLPRGAGDLMGVGHPLMEKALQQASRLHGVFCVVDGLDAPMQVIAVSNRVTGTGVASGRLAFGITGQPGNLVLLRDWEVLRALNRCAVKFEPAPELEGRAGRARVWLDLVQEATSKLLVLESLPFPAFHIAPIAVLWADNSKVAVYQDRRCKLLTDTNELMERVRRPVRAGRAGLGLIRQGIQWPGRIASLSSGLTGSSLLSAAITCCPWWTISPSACALDY